MMYSALSCSCQGSPGKTNSKQYIPHVVWCSPPVTGAKKIFSGFLLLWLWQDFGDSSLLFFSTVKMCLHVPDVLEGRDAIERDLNRLDMWACVNHMKFNKAKCKVLHLDRGYPKHKYKLGGECLKSSPETVLKLHSGKTANCALYFTRSCLLHNSL